MTEIKSLMADGRGQRPVRLISPMFDVRFRRSAIGSDQKGIGVLHDGTEHRADFMAFDRQTGMVAGRQVTAVFGEIKPRISFTILAIGIREFAQKMCLVSSFGPLRRIALRNAYGAEPPPANWHKPNGRSGESDRLRRLFIVT